MKYFKISLKFIGFFILLYILSQLDYKKSFSIIKNLDIKYLFLYSFSFFTYFILKNYRFYTIIKFFKEKPKFIDVLGTGIEAQYLGFVTPARLGESVRIIYLNQKSKIENKKLLISYIYDRFQDLYFVFTLGAVSTFFIITLKEAVYIYLFAIVLLIFFIFKKKILYFLAKKIKTDTKIDIDFKHDMILFFQNIAIYFFYFLQYYFLAKAFSTDIDFLYISAVANIGMILSLLPISVSGIGVRESAFIILLSRIGIEKEKAFLISFLDNAGFTVIFILILHFLYILFDKMKKNKRIAN